MQTISMMNRPLVLLFSLLFFMSCIEDEQRGYPRHVDFDENGGEVTVSGDDSFLGIVMVDDNDKAISYSKNPVDCDTIRVECQWLKAYQLSFDNKLVIVVQPLEDGVKKRSMELKCSFGDAIAHVKVTQKRKK